MWGQQTTGPNGEFKVPRSTSLLKKKVFAGDAIETSTYVRLQPASGCDCVCKCSMRAGF